MDKEIRMQILRASVRDTMFMKRVGRDINPVDFPEREEQIVAKAATEFFTNYEEAAGGMLSSYADEIMGSEKNLPIEVRKKVKTLIAHIQGVNMEQVSLRALGDRVQALKHTSFYEKATDNIIELQEKGELTADTLAELVERAKRELHQGQIITRNYVEEIDKRIRRRTNQEEDSKYPLLLIDPIDNKIRAIGKGYVGLWLAPYSSGKGLALVHLAINYALQGLNVLHLTLEDPADEVEDRMDASLTGLSKTKLAKLPNKLKKKFQAIKKRLKGRIRIIDGTEDDWTVTRIEQLFNEQKEQGFVADVIIVDYDDELKCEKKMSGENFRRFEFDEIYKRLRKAAKRMNVILWTAAQGKRESEGKRVITGKDVAEDIGKIRKVALAIGIGTDPDRPNVKHLYVLRHRLDRSRFGVDIVTDYDSGTFFDREETLKIMRLQKRKQAA